MPLARVRDFLSNHPELEIILFDDASTHTAALAAAALGVTEAQIAKTLVFIADGSPVVVVASGEGRIDVKRLGKEIGAKKLRFASPEAVQAATGFLPGGVCPFGLEEELPIYLEKRLCRFPVVYAAAGTANSAVPITPEDLQRITAGIVVDCWQSA